MPTITPEKTEAGNNLNPGERRQDERYSRDVSVKEQEEAAAQKKAADDAAFQEIAQANAGWANRVTKANTTGGGSKRLSKAGVKKLFKRGGPAGAIIGIVAAFFGISSGVGVMAPFSLVEGISDEFNDQLAALDIGEGNLRRHRIKAAQSASIKGCRTLSIQCKFATMSDTQVKRLERAGIKVSPKKSGPFGRTVPTEYEFRGQKYDPQAWSDELRSNDTARNAQRRANNMKYRGFADRTFVSKVLKRYGLSKAPPGLKGTKADRVNQLLTSTKASSAKDVTFREVTEDGKGTGEWELLDSDGKPVTDESGNPKKYNKDQYEKAQRALDRVSNAKPPSVATSRMVGAASALGYYDLACSMKNMIGAAGVAAKVANKSEIVKFSWNIVSTVHQIKAGDGDPETFEAVGELLMSEDGRKLISKVQDGGTENNPNEIEQVDNPNYGKSAMQAPEVLMALDGGVPVRHEMGSIFSVSGGMNTLLGGVTGFADIADAVLGLGVGACDFVQNPFVRGAGIAVSIAAGIATLGSSAATQAAIAGAMIAGMLVLDYALNSALSGSVLDVLEDGKEKVGVGTAIVNGHGAMQSDAAQSRGMLPANKERFSQYESLTREVQQKYIAMERENINEFDITSQYSALGSIMRLAYKQTKGESTLSSLISLGSAIPSLLTDNVLAEGTDMRRFDRCDDPDLDDLGIDCDVGGIVRHTMPQDELNVDIDTLSAYMDKYVDAETGLPEGYTPPDSGQSQNAVVGFVRGATVGQFFAERDTVNDYGKFLDYCVYRTAPYGKTFQEGGLFGAGEEKWQTGEMCLEQTEKLKNFRSYTFLKSLQESVDEEEQASYTTGSSAGSDSSQAPDAGGGGGGGEVVDMPSREGWSNPMKSTRISFSYHARHEKGLHKAIDLPGPRGTPVYAAHKGTVTKIQSLGAGCGIGTVISAEGLNGIWHIYQHMTPTVKVGDKVERGQRIGSIGDFCGSGYHLHFGIEAQNGMSWYRDSGPADKSKNPLDYLPLGRGAQAP